MSVIKDIYVDPSIAADSGTGTIGDPYGDLQYALDTNTRGTDGDEYHIKAGTAEVLAAALTITTGTPTTQQPVKFRGYTSAARDGGICEIDCSTNAFFSTGTYDNFQLCDAEVHNSTAAYMVQVDDYSSFINVHFHNCTGIALRLDFSNIVRGCFFEDIDGTYAVGGIGSANHYEDCAYIHDGGSKTVGDAFRLTNASHITRCCCYLDASENGINVGANEPGCSVIRNSILGNSGTKAGITMENSNYNAFFAGNIVEGFSGTGGVGIRMDNVRQQAGLIHNALYNNTSHITEDDLATYQTDNEILGSSGFAKSGTLTFANRAVYFAPEDVGNIIGGYFDLDKGAVQSAAAGGGTTVVINRPRRVM